MMREFLVGYFCKIRVGSQFYDSFVQCDGFINLAVLFEFGCSLKDDYRVSIVFQAPGRKR